MALCTYRGQLGFGSIEQQWKAWVSRCVTAVEGLGFYRCVTAVEGLGFHVWEGLGFKVCDSSGRLGVKVCDSSGRLGVQGV